MGLDHAALATWKFDEIRQSFTRKDTMLYALGLGLGGDPTDRDELRFVYEDGLQALPTMAVVLAYPGFWLKQAATGVNWRKVLHGEQSVRVFDALPVEGEVIGRQRVAALVDRGADKGAAIVVERDILDAATGKLLCTVSGTNILRGNGGFGHSYGSLPVPHVLPERAPDRVADRKTLPQAALIYRLSGDFNPLHADPDVAEAAGFPRPILHGLCSFGVVGYNLMASCADGDPTRVREMRARFSNPVFPGETLRTEIWDEGGGTFGFRARLVERDILAVNNGVFRVET